MARLLLEEGHFECKHFAPLAGTESLRRIYFV